MTVSEVQLYRAFVDRLLYQDTLQAIRESVMAMDGFDRNVCETMFDEIATRAELSGWTNTIALVRFVREQVTEALQPPSVPSDVSGPESLIRVAKAAPSALAALRVLRRNRLLVSADLYADVKAATMDHRRPDGESLRLLYVIARLVGDQDLIVESRLLWASFQRSAGDYRRAARHLRRAVAADAVSPRVRFLALGAQGGLYRAMSDVPRAINAFEECLRLTDSDPEIMSLCESLADCYRTIGQPAKAVDACNRALELSERMGISERVPRVLEVRGLSYEDLGDYERGRSDYLRAAAVAERTGDRQAQFVAMNNAAASLLKRGLAREGYQAFRDVLRTVEAWNNPVMVASTHNNLGQALLELEHFGEAREQFGKSLQLRINTGHRYSEGISFVGLGDAMEGLENYEAARVFFTMALMPALESGDPASLVSVQMRLAQRELLNDKEATQSAIESLRWARDLVRSQSQMSHDALATIRLAKLYQETGDRAAALNELESALKLIGHPDAAVAQQVRIARARLLVDEADGWAEGFAELQRLLAGVEQRLEEARLDARRAEIVSEMVGIHEAILRALAQPHAPARTDEERSRPAYAFDVHEAAKSRSMLAALADAPIPAPVTAPADLREQEARLLQRERSLQENAPDAGEAARLEQLADVRLQLEACWTALRPAAPDYVRFRSAQPYTLGEISGWLDRQTEQRVALLSLFSDEEGVQAFVLRRGQTEPSMLHLPIARQLLQSNARRLRRTFNGDTREFPPYPPIRGDAPHKRPLDFLAIVSSAFEPLWDALGDAELACIAPHGPLHLLPLHALSTGGQFVAQRFAITYTPSLSALLQMDARPRRDDGALRVLAAGVSSADDAHPDYFENDADLFDGTSWPVSASSGVAGAAKHRVLKQLREHSVVHVSCHGYFDERNPLRSGLVLSNGESKAPRDLHTLPFLERGAYLLTAGELIEADFAPRLVTLSACSTGLQQVRNHGDELDGFSRAVLLAGAATAVLGMWNLDQESSREFFRSFYRHVSGGLPKWRALNAAQREMIAHSREAWRHLYHWAPYYMVGDWGAI